MKKTIFLCLLLACFGCASSPDKGSFQEAEADAEAVVEEETNKFTKTFDEFGFSIAAPCVLEDDEPVNELWNDDYYNTYYSNGIIVSPDDPNKMTQYLVGVRQASKAFENLSEAEQNKRMEQIKKADFTDLPGVSNIEKVLFSEKKYPGYAGNRKFGEFINRTVTFNKGSYIITLSVLSDTAIMKQSELIEEFDIFTRSFKVID